MVGGVFLLRLGLLILLAVSAPVRAEPASDDARDPRAADAGEPPAPPASGSSEMTSILADLSAGEAPLAALRSDLVECEAGCLTPSEAVALAFDAGISGSRRGRVLLDIRSGGQSLFGNLDRLFFVNSREDYAQLGTLTIAFDEDVLDLLLKRARACGGGLAKDGRIAVEGCRQKGFVDPNMFAMMRRLHNRRIVVEGELRLQWIDSSSGIRPREGAPRGYYQPWIWVEDADQISFVYED
jgi:hypothetical protein